MSTKLLLTGAGFSRNWGGWLASEVFEYLIGCPGLSDRVRGKLWQHQVAFPGGFERVLSIVRTDAKASPEAAIELKALLCAIDEMFETMNAGLQEIDDAARAFLAQFTCIATLNQDLLLELFYGAVAPCMVAADSAAGPRLKSKRSPADVDFSSRPTTPLGPEQPYLKLHGSSDFVGPRDGRSMLIVGSGKEEAIHELGVLDWYLRLFRTYLMQPSTRLVVVGYRFADTHINKLLAEACNHATDFRLFIIDPAGVEVLSDRSLVDYTSHHTDWDAFVRPIRRRVWGASSRSLIGEVLRFGSTEWKKLDRFLGS